MPSWLAAPQCARWLAGETEKMVSLLPLKNSSKTGYEFVPLSKVADVERPIPAEWMRDAAIPVERQVL